MFVLPFRSAWLVCENHEPALKVFGQSVPTASHINNTVLRVTSNYVLVSYISHRIVKHRTFLTTYKQSYLLVLLHAFEGGRASEVLICWHSKRFSFNTKFQGCTIEIHLYVGVECGCRKSMPRKRANLLYYSDQEKIWFNEFIKKFNYL